MTLTPNNRATLTDALSPPFGHQLDAAIAATYSLDLTALLLTNLSFADVETLDEESINRLDPIRRLEAVRRHAARTTVFAQAGAIHVPKRFHAPFAFLEESVVEVAAPNDGLFHPKVWVLRFTPQAASTCKTQDHLHRVIVLSRNLTMDNSWDTVLVLDEEDGGSIKAKPAADFLNALPRLAVRPLSRDREAQVLDVAHSLRKVRLKAPKPYTGGDLRAIGLNGRTFWPFNFAARRILAVSPFLTSSGVRALEKAQRGRAKNPLILVSRPESLDDIGPKELGRFHSKILLSTPEPEVELEESPSHGSLEKGDATSPTGGTDAELSLRRHGGLHAKTYIVDLPSRRNKADASLTVTGSANLTSHPWGQTVEFVALLEGPTSETGVLATYQGRKENRDGKRRPKDGAQGLEVILADYAPTERIPLPKSVCLTHEVERYHRKLAEALPALHVKALSQMDAGEEGDDSRVQLNWRFQGSVPPPPRGAETSMWLASAKGTTLTEGLSERGTWQVARENVTPFIAVETVVHAGGEVGQRISRRCLLKAELTGDAAWRHKEQIFRVLNDRNGILRYLMFLLGDPAANEPVPPTAPWDVGGALRTNTEGSPLAPVIFERLVRATGRDDQAMGRIAELLAELKDHPRQESINLGDLFMLWDSVWKVHQERMANGNR